MFLCELSCSAAFRTAVGTGRCCGVRVEVTEEVPSSVRGSVGTLFLVACEAVMTDAKVYEEGSSVPRCVCNTLSVMHLVEEPL